MNKNDYIKEVDSISAPDDLKERIMKDYNLNKKSGKNTYKILAAVAACLVVIVGITAVSGMSLGAKSAADNAMPIESGYYENQKSSSYDYTSDEAQEVSVSSTSKSKSPSLMDRTEADRKIIKNANLSIQTKDFDGFISALNKKIEFFKGYTDSYNENNYSNKSAEIVVRVPSESLEKFLTGIDEIGTVQSKQISKSDVTDSYVDIESRIKALETEEKALLKILEKCKTVSETIEVQSRLSEVRAEYERYQSQKKSYDSQISYSTVTIDITEEERIVKNDGSFLAQLKITFSNSIYNIGNFFRNLAITLLGNILYILIFGVIAAVVIIIIRRKRRKNLK